MGHFELFAAGVLQIDPFRNDEPEALLLFSIVVMLFLQFFFGQLDFLSPNPREATG